MALEKDIVFIGIQGSGKGTQASILAEKHQGGILGTGDLFRSLQTQDTPLAQEIKAVLARGELVSDDLTVQLVQKKYNELLEEHQLIIFDGFPRNAAQYPAFTSLVDEKGRDAVCVYLHLSEQSAMERIALRAQKEGREDDMEEESVRKRINVFLENSLPLIEHFRVENKLIEINGEPSIEEVTAQIDNALKKLSI